MGEMPKIYTMDEVAALLRVSVRTIKNYVRGGQLKALRLGKYRRFTEDAVRSFLESGTEPGYFASVSPPSRRRAQAKEPTPEEPAPVHEEKPGLPVRQEREPEDAPAPASGVPASFAEAVREAARSAKAHGMNLSGLAARALAVYPEDPELADVVLVELTDRASIAEWRAESVRADAEGDSGTAKDARRRIHDMRLRQYGKPDRLEPRLAAALRELQAERPEDIRPMPRRSRPGAPRA